MCKAFSCLVTKQGTVIWKMGIDGHENLIKLGQLSDSTAYVDKVLFVRCEIVPQNGNYFEPDKWVFHLDEQIKPSWWTPVDEEKAWAEHKKWLAKLKRIIRRKPIIHPFKIKPPKITIKHLNLLKRWASIRASVRDSVWTSVWASVRASVGDSVGASVGASVRDSVWTSVWASVRASVGDSVWDSVWASVGAYIGSFFILPRKAWQYTEKIKTNGYPFQPAVDLWDMGLVPSFDGETWRLHGGPQGKTLWKGKLK